MCILHEVSFSSVLHRCPQCGAPLAQPISSCPYCDSLLAVAPWRQAESLQPDTPPHVGSVELGGHSYLLLGQLAQGRTRVYLARRHALLSELVVLKQGAVEQEWQNLSLLRQCDSFLYESLPAPVASQGDLFAYRWSPGFVHTLSEVQKQYPRGIEPQAMIWMANRLFDQLARVHTLGFVHGALKPEHVLIHARDHGLLLCGWSKSRRDLSEVDLSASLVLLQALLGRDQLRASPWKELFPRLARHKRAHDIQQDLQRAARSAFGPPRYQPFHLK